ncbi:hypothetical protein CHU_0798 [Cytophaga hutchinsonii ATCC 33406]|uniref:Uncharacterized protein n=2 Tax=Cytophaga hutchinsonii TaxID=985 RepID=A0A6N4SP96_CYTH3|nr:hypothetical protein CHU_0798 [Cytophaga hutchinsonii ATCC 33406]
MMTEQFDTQLTELYKTSKGATFQCDVTDRICLQFGDISASFKVRDFFIFRRTVKTVNIHEMIFNLSDEYDFEWIESPKNGISKQFTLCEIIQLRELLDGTKFALELNSVLHETLGDHAVL